jgi:hypothetical protein
MRGWEAHGKSRRLLVGIEASARQLSAISLGARHVKTDEHAYAARTSTPTLRAAALLSAQAQICAHR